MRVPVTTTASSEYLVETDRGKRVRGMEDIPLSTFLEFGIRFLSAERKVKNKVSMEDAGYPQNSLLDKIKILGEVQNAEFKLQERG